MILLDSRLIGFEAGLHEKLRTDRCNNLCPGRPGTTSIDFDKPVKLTATAKLSQHSLIK